MAIKVGDKVSFDTDKIEHFKEETSSSDTAVQEYRNSVLARVDQVGTVTELGYDLTTVLFAQGCEERIPTKYLVVLPPVEDQ